MNKEKIIFLKARDFTETFNVSVKFLRQNFKLYFLCLLLLAGPFILLYSFSSEYYNSVIVAKTQLVKAGRLINMNRYGWQYFLKMFLSFISLLAMMCTTYSFMVVYNEKQGGNFTVQDVAKLLKEQMGKIIGGFFLFLLLIVIFGGGIAVILYAISGASYSSFELLSFFLIIASIIRLPHLLWQLSASFLVIIRENEISFYAFGKTSSVMKDNFWLTWIVVICSTIMMYFISFLFELPAAITVIIRIFYKSEPGFILSGVYFIIFIISSFFSSLVFSPIYLISGFHYFSLEEKSEGVGLMERINEIGTTVTNNTTNQY